MTYISNYTSHDIVY